MKNWTKLIVFVSLMGSLHAYAQEYEGQNVKIHQSNEMRKKERDDVLLMPSESGVRCLLKKDGQYYVNTYNDQMQLTDSMVLFNKLPGEAYAVKVQSFADEIIIFYKVRQKQKRVTSAYYMVITSDDFSYVREPEYIGDFNNIADHYWLEFDKDHTVLLLFRRYHGKSTRTVQEMYDDFEFGEAYEIEEAPGKYYESLTQVSGEGEVFVYKDVYFESREEKKYDIIDRYHAIYRYNAEGQIVDVVKFETDGYKIRDTKFFFLLNGNLCFTGIFGDTSYSYNYNNTYELKTTGIFYFEFDKKSLELITKTYNPFPENMLEIKIHGMVDSRKKSVYKECNSKHRGLSLKGVEQLSNGNLDYVFEQGWFYYRSGEKKIYHIRKFDNIVICLNQKKVIEWVQRIPKAQFVDLSRTFNSILYTFYRMSTYAFVNDELHFFYLVRGYGMPDLAYIPNSPNKAYTSSHFVHATIGESGDKEVESLGIVPNNDVVPVLQHIDILRNDKLYVRFSKKKILRLGIINLN